MKTAVLALLALILAAVAYFFIVAPTPQVVQEATTTTTTTETRRATVSLELNYSSVVKIYAAGASMTLTGWWTLGVGPGGNYTFGKLTHSLPPAEISYWGATEGDVLRLLQCAGGSCTAQEYRGHYYPYRLRGKNHTVSYAGVCRHLDIEGIRVVEMGVLDADTLAALIPGVEDGKGKYESTSCIHMGVPLESKGAVRLDVVVYGQRIDVRLELESTAVALGNYSESRHRKVLEFIKSRVGS